MKRRKSVPINLRQDCLGYRAECGSSAGQD